MSVLCVINSHENMTICCLQGSEMEVFIRDLCGKTISLWVHTDDPTSTVAAKYCDQQGYTNRHVKLIYAGKNIHPREDGKTVADFNIQKESTLHEVLSLRGD